MADPFVAEVRIFPFNFPPTGWAFCDGQLMPLSQNTALFALLGTVYGGDGKSTFALPDLQGRAAMHSDQGPGLYPHDQGEMGGSDTVALLVSEMPAHSHTVTASFAEAVDRLPGDQKFANAVGMGMYAVPGPVVQMAAQALPAAGGSYPHNNMQPYLTLNFCIALQGVFPPRP